MGEQTKNLNFTIRYNICRDLHRSVIETDDMAKALEEYTSKLVQLDANESVVNLDCLDGNTIITFEGKNQIEQYLSLVSQIVYIDAYKYYSFREKRSLNYDTFVFE